MELRFEDVRLRYKQKNNVFRTRSVNEPEKLPIHSLMVRPMVEPRLN